MSEKSSTSKTPTVEDLISAREYLVREQSMSTDQAQVDAIQTEIEKLDKQIAAQPVAETPKSDELTPDEIKLFHAFRRKDASE